MDFIDSKILDYALLHSDIESDLLKELERETYQKILQPRMLSGPLQGRFLSLLSKIVNPKTILEVGTFTGYGTLCLAEGLQKDGLIHTIDNNDELIDFQKNYFKRSGYKDQIKCHLGEAKDLISQIDLSYDLIFLDADKANYLNYFNLLIPKLNPKGILIADNVLWSGKVLEETSSIKDMDTLALKKFNEYVTNDHRVETLLLPLRDGLTICRKI
jgi:predicted O-methyltransferase YrrM